MISYMSYIHRACHHAPAAAAAAFRTDPDSGQGKAIEKTVDRAQRAEKPAEAAVAEDTGQANGQHNNPFLRKYGFQLEKGGTVCGVLQQPNGAFQGTGRADILAEGWQRNAFSHTEEQRYGNDKYGQYSVLQVRQCPRYAAFADLERRNSVQQLLDQAQRTDPAADGSAENYAEQGQDPHDVPGRCMPRCTQGVLQGTERAAGNRSRTGIAVQSRHADGFQTAGVDMPVNEAFQVRVVQQGGIQLYQPAGGRLGNFWFSAFFLIQDRYTPYR